MRDSPISPATEMKDSREEEEGSNEEMEGSSEEEESSNGEMEDSNKEEESSNEEMEDSSEEEESSNEEISAKYLAMECSEARCSTGETKNLLTNESSQPSDIGEKFDVFLSHSGEQKNFIRQLQRDLTNQGFSCFFDQDRKCLPLGEDFPPRIFQAAKTCSLAVFLLSKEFLQSKWPMLELSTVVEADTNPRPKILPLFFMIPPKALKQIKADNENWNKCEINKKTRVKWVEALKAIRRKNGLTFSEGGNEVEFRDEIVKEIWCKIPKVSPRYHVPCMQGELRMCQAVADFFENKVHPNGKGISIAGLYGIVGQGKSTLGKAFCNYKLKDFEGKVCHLEFSRCDSFERTKLALRYLIHYSPWHLENLTKDQAQVEFRQRVKGQRVLLVLDNIIKESIGEVRDFMEADLGENSCILLSTRSSDVLVKNYDVDLESCMRVPSLEVDDAIAILLESTSLGESKLVNKDKDFALKCANRCSFKEINCDNGRRGRTFHPLALKAFGSHLCGKYGPNLSKWVPVIDDLVDRPGYGLEGVVAVLDKTFDDMNPKYRIIFMLLTVYILPNMSPHNVIEWLAINCNEEIPFIWKAVEDLCKKAFIEEFEPEIRIHDLYIEFAQRKAKEMGRWLWWKGDERSTRGLISEDDAGFELAKFERCMYRGPFQIAPKYLKNLLALQLIGMQNMSNLDLGRMESLRSITLQNCKVLPALDGLENLLNLAWLQIRGVDRMLKLPNLSSLIGLQHLEIDIAVSEALDQLGDLTSCFCLREFDVRCPSLLEFPRLNGLPHLENVKFSSCDKVKAPLDCRECVELQSIVLVSCRQMAESPLLAGCKKLSKIVLSECDEVTAFPDINVPSALETRELQISPETASAPISLVSCDRLENLQLWDMRELKELPSFRSLSNLTVLKIGKCGIREPPDLTCCVMLEDVNFFTLRSLIRFPNFSLLRRLKILSLCNCRMVRDPPDISGCHQLQLFHLLYNDNMKGLSKMDKCAQLEEIKVSWHCEDEVTYDGFDPDSFQVDDDLESCLDCFKDVILQNINGASVPKELEQWLQGKTMVVKKYFRGLKLYYSVTAPYQSDKILKHYNENSIALRLVNGKVLPFPTPGRVDEHDVVWLKRVRKYFARQDIARASTASVSAKYLPMDQTHTTQLKKLSSPESSQARRSKGETKNLLTTESSLPNKWTRSDHGQKFDVFLSHSGEKKIFVRHLYKDLADQGVSCFFDEDRTSLPVGEDFPTRIFEAAKTCSVAVFLLSKEFLQSKWPMLELSTFVKARDTNHDLKIIPLYFTIPPDALKKFTADDEKWKKIEKSEEKRAEWQHALKAIRKIKGLKFGGIEVEFRDNIVKAIYRRIPKVSPRYHVPCMQGELRMCQEVADFFTKVHLNVKGIRIAGLYGIAGQGKTTLGKAFCNHKLKDFEGKVCHLEFSRDSSFKRTKLALKYLFHCTPSYLENLTEEEAQIELGIIMEGKRVFSERVLLVLDNITEDSINEVRYFIKPNFREGSCILLTAQSLDVLVKYFNIDPQSCMRVPSLKEKDAIAILLESMSPEESMLGPNDKDFALKCAKRCSFKETSCDNGRSGRTFHPLALKAFGSHLCGKYGSNLSKWDAVIDGLADQPGYGLEGVFNLLDEAFDDMDPKYRTIFMLLTVYILPNMSPHNVIEWLAINCNEEISVIEKALEDLCKKAFLEEFEPEIRIHDLYIFFGECKAQETGRWLWWKGDKLSTRGLISQGDAGFELAKFERCMHPCPFPIYREDLRNLKVLQLVGVQNISNLDLGSMQRLTSITLHDCKVLPALDGMENLLHLAWLQITGVDRILKLPNLSSLIGLQHLEIDIAVSQVLGQLGDLTPCSCLREINVRCSSLLEFPKLKGLPYLEKVEFRMCDEVKTPLDCRECVELQSIVLVSCCQMAESPLLAGCMKLSKIVLAECDAVTAFPDINVPSALKTLELQISPETASAPITLGSCDRLENFQLWDMRELKELPSFRSLYNLTVLKIGKCGIREPPDLTCCVMLEDVYFFTLKSLIRFPNFSLLRRLKKLSLCNCMMVRDPPDISGCHQLQLFHLLYNDNMKGLSKMDKCTYIEEIKVSWHCKDELTYEGIDPDSFQVDDDLESCLDCFKDVILENLNGVSVPEELEQWLQGKTMVAKKYFRGLKLYYSVTAPCQSDKRLKHYNENSIALRLVDSKVFASPRSGSVNQDWVWVARVRKYLAGQDIARASTTSGKALEPALNGLRRLLDGKVIAFPTYFGWLNRVRKYFARASSASGEAKFRGEIVKPISRLPPQKYDTPVMQGEARMCQAVVDFFNNLRPNEKGIHIAGLCGMAGVGKTTLAKAFCNFNLGNFDGRVYRLEFLSGGHSMDRENFRLLTKSLQGQRVLLVLDNIQTEEGIEVVNCFLRVDLGKKSWILLTTRSAGVLNKFNVQSCMRVPGLKEKEAIAILLERTSLAESALKAGMRSFVLQCAKRCSFKENSCQIFHPLALRTLGGHLFRKYGSDLSKWVDELDGLAVGDGNCVDDKFTLLDKAFDCMDPKCHTIFTHLTVNMPPNMNLQEVTEWLAVNCNEEIHFIEKAIEDLWQKGFIEEIKPQIRIHDLYMEFAERKAGKMGRCLSCNGDLITSEAIKMGSYSSEAGFHDGKLDQLDYYACLHDFSFFDFSEMHHLSLLDYFNVFSF